MTTLLVLPAKIVRRDNMVLRDIQIVTMASRAKGVNDYAVVDVGIQAGDRFESLGRYDQRSTMLDEGEPKSIILPGALNRRLRDGQSIVVRVSVDGAPDTLLGTCVDLLFALTGSAVGPERALVSVGTAMQDPRARIALESAVAQVNTAGLSDVTVTVALQDPVEDHSDAYAVGNSYSPGAQTFTAGAGFSATSAAFTLTKPSWATSGKVKIEGCADAIGNGGAGEFHLEIFDGATGQNPTAINVSATAASHNTAHYAGTITATTTFTLYAKAVTANVDVMRQTLTGSVMWT